MPKILLPDDCQNEKMANLIAWYYKMPVNNPVSRLHVMIDAVVFSPMCDV